MNMKCFIYFLSRLSQYLVKGLLHLHRSRHLINRSNRSTGRDSDGLSSRSKWSKESDQTRKRYGQESPTQTLRGRGGWTNRQQRLLEIMEKIAVVPTQEITPYEHRFKNMTHPVLPIRSLKEDCSHVNQFRQWVFDRHCLPVPEDTAQFNNGLHSADWPLDVFVYQIV